MGIEEVLGEPDPVAEQRAVGERRGRIDRQHRDLAIRGAAQLGQRADERRLAGPGRAGQPDDARVAGVREDLAYELPARGVVGLDQGDGPGQRALVAAQQALGDVA